MDCPLTENIRSGEGPLDIEAYEKGGGYGALRKALQSMAPGRGRSDSPRFCTCVDGAVQDFRPAASGLLSRRASRPSTLRTW